MRLIDADRLKVVLEKNYGHTGGASVLAQLIDEQPTIQPERKKGKWIEIENEWGGLEIICSECRAQVPRDAWGNAVQSDYCYRCGADMKGEENGCNTGI